MYGFAMLTPEMIHFNLVDDVIEKRNIVLQKAYKSNPNRFVKGVSKAKLPANDVWINKPQVLKHVA